MNMMWSNGKKKTPKQKSPLTIIEREFRWVFFCWCWGALVGVGCMLSPQIIHWWNFIFFFLNTPYSISIEGQNRMCVVHPINCIMCVHIRRIILIRYLFSHKCITINWHNRKRRDFAAPFQSGDNHIRTWSIIYTPLLYICASQFYIPTHWYKNKIKILWKLIYLFFSVWSPLSGLSLAE